MAKYVVRFDAPDLLNESNKEDEELSLDKGLTHANALPMAERYKVFRSEELSLFVKKPFKSIKSRLDKKYHLSGLNCSG